VSDTIAALREAIALADGQNDDAMGGEARVFLAEVLVQEGTEAGRAEARALLETALRLASRTTVDPDLIGAWRLAASELLLELESRGPSFTSRS
jgi:hypothetical protein